MTRLRQAAADLEQHLRRILRDGPAEDAARTLTALMLRAETADERREVWADSCAALNVLSDYRAESDPDGGDCIHALAEGLLAWEHAMAPGPRPLLVTRASTLRALGMPVRDVAVWLERESDRVASLRERWTQRTYGCWS